MGAASVEELLSRAQNLVRCEDVGRAAVSHITAGTLGEGAVIVAKSLPELEKFVTDRIIPRGGVRVLVLFDEVSGWPGEVTA